MVNLFSLIMLGMVLRKARAQGAPLLDTNLEWTWPKTCCDDGWVPSHLMVSCRTELQRRSAAARLQSCIRRRLLEQEACVWKEEHHDASHVVSDNEWDIPEDDGDVSETEWDIPEKYGHAPPFPPTTTLTTAGRTWWWWD